jgi:hypothetical protein
MMQSDGIVGRGGIEIAQGHVFLLIKTVIASGRKRDDAAHGFARIKQRQNAATMREDAAMFARIIALH